MKRAVVLCLLLALTVQAQSRWREVSRSIVAVVAVDASRDELDGETVTRFEKVTPRLDTEQGREIRAEIISFLSQLTTRKKAARYSYQIARREYACSEGRSRRLETSYHDRQGAMIYRAREPEPWESPIAESSAETAMLDACRRQPREMY